MWHTIGGQAVKFSQTELQSVKSKNIGHGQIQLGALPGQQIAPGRRRKPVMQTYNLTAHEVNSATRFYRQLHLAVA